MLDPLWLVSQPFSFHELAACWFPYCREKDLDAMGDFPKKLPDDPPNVTYPVKHKYLRHMSTYYLGITYDIGVTIPFRFFLRHHLSGAGLVRVSGTERVSRLSCCTIELDVCVPGPWIVGRTSTDSSSLVFESDWLMTSAIKTMAILWMTF